MRNVGAQQRLAAVRPEGANDHGRRIAVIFRWVERRLASGSHVERAGWRVVPDAKRVAVAEFAPIAVADGHAGGPRRLNVGSARTCRRLGLGLHVG